MKIVKKQKSGAVAMTRRVTVYPTYVPNPLLADVEHDLKLQIYVAVDTATREIVSKDIVLHLLLNKEELIGYEVGLDPSCEAVISTVDKGLDNE